jgi:hypothetical protein
MVELQEKKVKVEGETVRVYVRFREMKGGESRRRFYTHDALQLVKDTHPKLDVGRALKVCTAKNYGNKLDGEWVFELHKRESDKRKHTRTKTSSKKSSLDKKKEEEVVSE